MKSQSRVSTFVITAAAVLFGNLGITSSVSADSQSCDSGSLTPYDDPGIRRPMDFGDLVFLHRDERGVPILTSDSCQQPIGFPSETCALTCVAGEPCLVPVNPDTCAIEVAYEGCTHEVDFGRLNVARSPGSVLSNQLQEVIVNLATADCISLDPSGRLVLSTVVDAAASDDWIAEYDPLTHNLAIVRPLDGLANHRQQAAKIGVVASESQVLTSAVDSPLQNLAIYKQLMSAGYLGTESSPIALPATPLDSAARALGAAADKTGDVNIDLVTYLNQILGLTNESAPGYLEKTCIDIREEIMGQVDFVRKCFLDYGSYGYQRSFHFSTLLPFPAYIPTHAPLAGYFEYLTEVLPITNPVTFLIAQEPITSSVFNDSPGYVGGNALGFAQAADDSRAVIEFMHDNPLPLGYYTQVACDASGDTAYDLSISDVSGLQVPVNMIAGNEGREFSVTVGNAGPDAATGVVTVTAVNADGVSVATFPRIFEFEDLAGNLSASWTELFIIDYATTISWTATVEAEFDVNPANDSVTESTTVIEGGN